MSGLITFTNDQGQSLTCHVMEETLEKVSNQVIPQATYVEGFDTREELAERMEEVADLVKLQQMYESAPRNVRIAFLDRLGFGGNC